MTLFLTSGPGGYYKDGDRTIPCCLNEKNGFVDKLKAHWQENAQVLFITAYPDGFEKNDSNRMLFQEALPLSGLPVSQVDVCDSRNPSCDLSHYDVVILGGGHVPTQHAFFQKIGLKAAIANFDGIVMGISAGTMNCATTVYAQPELSGETMDPEYQRFIPGLGLTDIMVLPHYQIIKDDILDGLRVIEDITFQDSMCRSIYALVDGSYILIQNGTARLFGEGYLIRDGVLTPLCQEGEHCVIA